MPYYKLHYHLIWATYQREPWLTEDTERQVYATILNKAQSLACVVHAIGGIEDHIHLAISVPPKLALAEVVGQLKGASSYHINHQPQTSHIFRWQSSYGALTFGERSMKTIVAYIKRQKEHHHKQTTMAVYERIITD